MTIPATIATITAATWARDLFHSFDAILQLDGRPFLAVAVHGQDRSTADRFAACPDGTLVSVREVKGRGRRGWDLGDQRKAMLEPGATVDLVPVSN